MTIMRVCARTKEMKSFRKARRNYGKSSARCSVRKRR